MNLCYRIKTLFLATILMGASLPLFGQTVAYTHATIETMGPAGQLQDSTLLVRDDKIVDVGSDIEIPDNARIINLTGKTILPGLIDPYYVYKRAAGSGGRTVVFNGRTFTIPNRTGFTAGNFKRIGQYFYPFESNFMPAVRSGITTANLVSDGQGLSAFAHLSQERNAEMLFQPEGFVFAKVTNQTSALDIIRKPLKPVSKKTPTTKKSSETSAKPSTTSPPAKGSGTSNTESTKELWNKIREGKTPLFVNVNNEAGVAYLLQILKDHKEVRLVLVATGPNLFQSLESIKANPNVTVVLQPGVDRVPFKSDLMNVSHMLANKGIPFAISMSLSSSQLVATQDDPMFPLAMLVRTGLDRQTALKAVTSEPAALLGIEKTHGTLEKEKQASFLVFEGDPLGPDRHLRQVILNGNKTYEN